MVQVTHADGSLSPTSGHYSGAARRVGKGAQRRAHAGCGSRRNPASAAGRSGLSPRNGVFCHGSAHPEELRRLGGLAEAAGLGGQPAGDRRPGPGDEARRVEHAISLIYIVSLAAARFLPETKSKPLPAQPAPPRFRGRPGDGHVRPAGARRLHPGYRNCRGKSRKRNRQDAGHWLARARVVHARGHSDNS
jgi:hypothetical protein